MSINIRRFKERFDEEYMFCYNNRDNVAGFEEAVDAFMRFVKDPARAEFVRAFNTYREDAIVSDREAAAFMFTLESFAA